MSFRPARPLLALLAFVVCLSALVAPSLADPAAAQGADTWPPPPKPSQATACSEPLVGADRTFNVGPGQDHTELTTVPWLSLGPGDVVNIFHRSEPYRTKLGLRAQGTVSAPLVINGVTNGSCARPVISGSDAITSDDAIAAQFFNKQWTEFLGTIFIYRGPDDPFGYIPSNITIQNLEITGASTEDAYTGQDGTRRNYGQGAAGVYAVVVENLTLENNVITGNGNGVFVNTKSEEETSRNIVIRHNRIYGNGTPGSYLEHNLYIQARRSLFEGNYIGQLVVGAEGSSLKDRSSGTVIRFNRIDAAARAIDLVEIEGGVGPVLNDPLYGHAWVYGNVITTDHSREALSGSLLIHWGGDNDPRYFRNGTLHFSHNTLLINSTRAQRYYFAIFDMPDDRQRVVAHSNVIASLKDALLYLGRDHGTVELSGTNWLSDGWSGSRDGTVEILTPGTVITGANPGLGSDFRPEDGSPVIDRVTPVPIVAPDPADGSALGADWSFVDPSGLRSRQTTGAAPDLGAFEAGTVLPPPPPPPPPPGDPLSVSGSVSYVDGTPAVDVSVDLFVSAGGDTRGEWLGDRRSDTSGEFDFEVAADCYVVTVIAPQGESFVGAGRWHQESVCVADGSPATPIAAVLAGGADSDTELTGSVTNAAGSGEADVAADLFEAMADGSRGRWLGDQATDGSGAFRHQVVAGCYVVTLIAPDNRSFVPGGPWHQAGRCIEAGGAAPSIDAVLN